MAGNRAAEAYTNLNKLPIVQDAAWWIQQAEQQGLGGYDYSAVVAQIRGRTATG
jgi:hypothetical protein